ncbi:phospholipase A [Geobacter sp. FeAm09]|uniref:phospholipase A n=1 Tax=Geobacter sp. FeAm09 TaxID=2597769 RepID=UPI0011EF0ECE|nr:phospholipase A [Geobacter sp. FeAm09]QEM70228.1 phospholipase A [Geobacter sp. FeAm09]
MARDLLTIFIVLSSLFVTDDMTCAETVSALDQRIYQEKRSNESMFSIQPYKTNYILPATYNTLPNNGLYSSSSNGNENIQKQEVKFQLSLKAPLLDNIFINNGTLFVAYTQLAFWQAYNSSISSPFREINFEPEIFMCFKTDYKLLGLTGKQVGIGFDHQSNGMSKPLSRSWNRVVANFVFESRDTYIALRPWFRIPEKAKDDDNPSIEKYYGYGELNVLQKLNKHTLTFMLRNNLRPSGNKGAVQFDWSFPLHKKFKGYVQYFIGYGESLVDYNHLNNRIGIGVMLTDWL